MSEKRTPVQILQCEYICDRCGSGRMERVGAQTFLTDPPQYPYKCSECGYLKCSSKRYPYLITNEGVEL